MFTWVVGKCVNIRRNKNSRKKIQTRSFLFQSTTPSLFVNLSLHTKHIQVLVSCLLRPDADWIICASWYS